MIEKIFYEIDEDFWCETKYLNNIFDILKTKLVGDYSVVITPNLRMLPETKFKKIVILTGDELGNLGINPYSSYDVLCVFRIYNHMNRFDNKFIYPIPTGYNWTMHNDRTKKMIKMYPEVPLSERKYDIFYTGQLVPTRQIMVNNLNKLKDKFNILSNITGSFRTGYEIDEYYKLLGQSKIALSPNGTSVDCFRYNEAFGSGCIVITTLKEDLWYYRDSPAFFINSWEELTESLILNILSMDIDDIYEKNLKYYNEKLSEDAVANYIIKNINMI